MSGWLVGRVWVVRVVDVGVLWGEGEGGGGGRGAVVGEGCYICGGGGGAYYGRWVRDDWADDLGVGPWGGGLVGHGHGDVWGGGVAVSVPRSRSAVRVSRGGLVWWGGGWVWILLVRFFLFFLDFSHGCGRATCYCDAGDICGFGVGVFGRGGGGHFRGYQGCV